MNAQLVREQSIYNIANVPNLEARQEMASASKILVFIIVITVFLSTAYTGTQGNTLSVQSTSRDVSHMHANLLLINLIL